MKNEKKEIANNLLCIIVLFVSLLLSFPTIADDHGSTFTTATRIWDSDGSTEYGEIEIADDAVYFRFFAESGNGYTIETNNLSDGLNTVIYIPIDS